MFRKAALSLTLALTVVSLAYAATPVGRWQGSIDAAGMPLAARFSFAVDGSVLTGTLELPEHGAEFAFENGTVKGDSVRFSVDLAGMATFNHRGRVAGDTLYLVTNVGTGESTSTFLRIP